MNAALDLLPLLLLAVLPALFIIQFFNAHSRNAAWAAPATSTLAPVRARTFANNVTDINAPTIALAA